MEQEFHMEDQAADEIMKFINGITFRSLSPLDPHVALQEPQKTALEFYNTALPEDGAIAESIISIWDTPKMSTFAIGAIINKIVSLLPNGSCYLNVGVWNGFSFLAGMVGNPDKICIGVDNFSEFGGPREEFLARFTRRKSETHQFFNMSYDEYLKTHIHPVGLYFYDGNHSYRNQLEGLELAEPFLTRNSFILIDDVNWPDPYRATMDFLAKRPGRYQIVMDRRTAISTHPTFWNGLLILRKLQK